MSIFHRQKSYSPIRTGIVLFVFLFISLLFTSISQAVTPEEQIRIDALLDTLASQNDLTFIRNGSTHSAQEAVEHLKLKLRKAGKRLNTAEEFIDYLATASSISNKPYLIQKQTKETVPAGAFILTMLRDTPPLK